MKACIASYYMSNINKRTVDLQTKVVKKFNKSKLPHFSICGEMPHGAFIDFIWYTQGLKVLNSPLEKSERGTVAQAAKEYGEKLGQFDVILFLDIDCVPVSDNAIDFYVQQASEGKLIGNAQRSGHIQNNNHVFAAPSAVAISKNSFLKIGTPSAMETTRGDVAEEYTFAAELAGLEIDFSLPVRYDREVFRYDWEKDKRPYWTLENGLPNFGLGTTYGNVVLGDLFWHNFQIRIPGQEEKFWAKCEELLNGE
jgi:hypothetical protein